jgi:hypothetical protein
MVPVRDWLAAKNCWRHGENFFLDSPFIEPLPVLTLSKYPFVLLLQLKGGYFFNDFGTDELGQKL